MTKAELVNHLRLAKTHVQGNRWNDALRVLDALRPVLVERREKELNDAKPTNIRVRQTRQSLAWVVLQGGVLKKAFADEDGGRDGAVAFAHWLAKKTGGSIVEIQE
jgi:hypothetical protein